MMVNRIKEQVKDKIAYTGLYVIGLLLSALFLFGFSWLMTFILP